MRVSQDTMSRMTEDRDLTELRRGVLGPCVLALLEERTRFGLVVHRLQRAAKEHQCAEEVGLGQQRVELLIARAGHDVGVADDL